LLVGKTSSSFGTAGTEIDGSSGRVWITRSDAEPLTLNRLTSNGDIIDFAKDGSGVGSIGAYSGDLYIGTGDTGARFVPASDALIPWNPSTNNAKDNAMDLGLSTQRFKDLYLSGGVYLGGTGSANLLDDYEEGSFVPYVSLTYNPNGRTITDNGAGVGRYTKIGNTVYCEIKVAWTGISGSGSRNVGINNLPFTKATDITVVNGAGRSNINGYMYQMESVTGTTVNVIRRYDNGTPLDVDNIDCFIVYRAA